MPPPENRRAYIVKIINEQGAVGVLDLATSLDVSTMTVRRDLVELEKEGVLRRVHGGAVSTRGRSVEPPYSMRLGQASTAKQRIGALAAELVAEGDSIALDIGSTTIEVAQRLVGRRNLTILTPSLRIAGLFLNQPDVRVIVPGGIVRTGEGSLIGELTRYALERLFVDRLFLGVGCIDAQYGLSEYNWDDALVKQAMLRSAKQVILVADSSKFDKVAFAHVAPFTAIHTLVTESAPPAGILQKLQEAHVQLLVAEPESYDVEDSQQQNNSDI
jgi:DeoR/GlpR family transcriptional regulator of sugar metabolism